MNNLAKILTQNYFTEPVQKLSPYQHLLYIWLAPQAGSFHQGTKVVVGTQGGILPTRDAVILLQEFSHEQT